MVQKMQNKNFERLSEGFKALHLSVNEVNLEKMDTFLQLLLKWNKVYNLTSINNETEAIDKHLLDSATLIPLLKEFEQPNGKTSVMDVGCGGGLPGIPAAILLPNFRFTLVDTVAKKIAFVSQAIINLKLLNAQAVNARVESYCPEEKFDLITSRAFASISTFINLTEKK